MKNRRIFALALCFALLLCACFPSTAMASVFAFETQYEYDAADPAWLTDLVIKEDLEGIASGDYASAVRGCTLTASPDYPYTATAESFKKEVAQFCELYSFSEDTFKISFVYLINLLGANSSLFAAQATDAEVKAYLQNAGIAYPDDATSEMKVLAKALYTAMVSGAFKGVKAEDASAGVQLEKALTSFIVEVSGFSAAELQSWVPGGSLETLDDYVLSVARLTLWSNGYDVTLDTPENDVYRLLAVMTIRNIGISVDADADFSELQAQYTAAMLGTKYDVTVDPAQLTEAVQAGNPAFYILQLIGQKQGLTVRTDTGSYEDTFLFVASHTDLFNIEEGEFYADIYNYDVYLTAPRASLWVYPTSYYGGVSASSVSITCNGVRLKDNYFTEVPISAAESVQKLSIKVSCTAAGGSEKEYVITVHSEDAIERHENEPQTTAPSGQSKIPSSSDIVSGILTSIGVDPGVVEAAGNLMSVLPQNVQSAIRFISPTFNGDGAADPAEEETQPGESVTGVRTDRFIQVLDSLGAIANSLISGVDGVRLFDQFKSDSFAFNYITFR